MDFGDILDEWDRHTAKARGKKAVKKSGSPGTGGTGPEPPGKPHPLDLWLNRNGVMDKDTEDDVRPGVSPGERRSRLLRRRADAEIDLHGLTRDEAWETLENFFRAGRQQGFEKLLVIHGKGNHSDGEGVLKETTRQFIEACSFAGESGHAPAAGGGRGATWVLLKP
jgi:DNA-nicking Smr family endonuclease